MQQPVLYSFRRCPYAIRARMAMAKAGIDCEHREVSLKNKPQEMVGVSNKGTVPVLVLSDGQVIDESLDVMLWALKLNDPDRWLETDMEGTIKLINENDFEFKPNLDRYKYHVLYPQHSKEQYREIGEPFLLKLNKQLEKYHGDGLFDTRTTLADVAIFPFIRQFAGVDRDWFEKANFKNLANWLKCLETSNDFLSNMQKHDFWVTGNA